MQIEFRPETHEYFVNCIKQPSVTQILQQEGISDFSGVREDVLRAASEFGTAVHRATELADNKILDVAKLSLPLVPYLEAWQKFKSDFKVKIVDVELRVYSKIWGYCGSIDRVAEIDGYLTVIDIKSSTTMAISTSLQLAGYQLAYNEGRKVKAKNRMAVQIKGDGTYIIYPYTNRSDESVWKALVTANRFKRNHNLIKGDK